MSNVHILPDSRLKDRNLGTVMVDWPLPDGTTVRVECCPTFCVNCGRNGPHVPKDNTHYDFYLCQQCFDKYGEVAGHMAVPDNEFCEQVKFEMMEHFGHYLNPIEVQALAEQGWGPLAKLIKESPIKGV